MSWLLLVLCSMDQVQGKPQSFAECALQEARWGPDGWLSAVFNIRESDQGVKILGGPVGLDAFVWAWRFARQTATLIARHLASPERQLTADELALPGVLQATSASLLAESSALLLWAVERCTLADGYIPATAQEVLLWLFLGERGAAQLVDAADQRRGSHHALCTEGVHTLPQSAWPPGHPDLPGVLTNQAGGSSGSFGGASVTRFFCGASQQLVSASTAVARQHYSSWGSGGGSRPPGSGRVWGH